MGWYLYLRDGGLFAEADPKLSLLLRFVAGGGSCKDRTAAAAAPAAAALMSKF